MAFFRAAREAATTLPCPACAQNLQIRRTCHEAFMFCPHCQQKFDLEPFIPLMDTAMEDFLENLYADRV